MKKLQSKEDAMKPMRLRARKDMLGSLKSMMREDMHGKLKDGLKGKMKVMVSADSPEDLQEGVDQAKESLADMIKAGFLKSKGKEMPSEESEDGEMEESDEMSEDEMEDSEEEMCPKCEGKGCMACGGIAHKE